jgi:hypothetical protein
VDFLVSGFSSGEHDVGEDEPGNRPEPRGGVQKENRAGPAPRFKKFWVFTAATKRDRAMLAGTGIEEQLRRLLGF